MSLEKAVLSIAADLEKEINEIIEELPVKEGDFKLLSSLVKQLRTVCEMGGTNQLAYPLMQGVAKPSLKRTTQSKEEIEHPDDLMGGSQMVLCVGGMNDGVAAPMKGNVPRDGSVRAELMGEVYILKEDGNLHFSASETLKLQEARNPKKILVAE